MAKKKVTGKLSKKHCVPCKRGMPKLKPAVVKSMLAEIPGWKVKKGRLSRRIEFEDFLTLMEYVNDVAQIAESEEHHPDFSVHYNLLDVELWTHAIDGLSENDFIVAAKMSELLGGGE